MIKLGLTGSIGMGKSTTGKMLINKGFPLHDADAVVHDLYKGEAVSLIEKAFPGTTNENGVDRQALSKQVLGNAEAMKTLEAIVHPLVHQREREFFALAKAKDAKMVVLDIPLLFETKGEDRCDLILVVSAGEDIQQERVLARPDMTVEKFEAIKARQLPDAEKRKRADYVLDTGKGLEAAERQLDEILADIEKRFP